jgi:hypothetical protein
VILEGAIACFLDSEVLVGLADFRLILASGVVALNKKPVIALPHFTFSFFREA